MTAFNALPAPAPTTGWRRLLGIGIGLQCATVAVFLSWASLARLDGGAVASGVLSAESSKKVIQHLEGGIVGEIRVRDGDSVKEGDILVRLDPTRALANATAYRKQLAAVVAQEAKLAAERDFADRIEFSPEVVAWATDPTVARAMQDQERSFRSRRDTLNQQIAITETQIAQVGKEIEALELERQTSEAQLVFVAKEVAGLRTLLAKQLIQLSRVTTMERDELGLKGSIARIAVSIAKAEQRIVETKLQVAQLRQEYQQEAAKQLPDLRRTISDLRQQIVLAEDEIARIDIRSPIDGQVQELKVFTVGGVVRAGEPVLSVVPKGDKLVVKAKVSPIDADRVHPGMQAEVKFSSFKMAVLKLSMGVVKAIGSDRQVDEANPEGFFAAEIELDKDTVPAEVENRLMAGLPVDIVIPTGQRTALDYFLTPIHDALFRSMRED